MAAEAGHPIHDPLWKPGGMDPEAPLLEKLPCARGCRWWRFADLIMVVVKKVEELIARLAQKARAVIVHLIASHSLSILRLMLLLQVLLKPISRHV